MAHNDAFEIDIDMNRCQFTDEHEAQCMLKDGHEKTTNKWGHDCQETVSGHGFTPPGFAPCPRPPGHTGPCAHALLDFWSADGNPPPLSVAQRASGVAGVSVVAVTARDPACAALGQHAANCGCIGTMRGPIPTR